MKANGMPTRNQVISAGALLDRYFNRATTEKVLCKMETPKGPQALSPYERTFKFLDKAEETFSAKKIAQLPKKTRNWFG
jgi:hypothetical protein